MTAIILLVATQLNYESIDRKKILRYRVFNIYKILDKILSPLIVIKFDMFLKQ